MLTLIKKIEIVIALIVFVALIALLLVIQIAIITMVIQFFSYAVLMA